MKIEDAALARIRSQTLTIVFSPSLGLVDVFATSSPRPRKPRAWIDCFAFLAVGEFWRAARETGKNTTQGRGHRAVEGVK